MEASGIFTRKTGFCFSWRVWWLSVALLFLMGGVFQPSHTSPIDRSPDVNFRSRNPSSFQSVLFPLTLSGTVSANSKHSPDTKETKAGNGSHTFTPSMMVLSVIILTAVILFYWEPIRLDLIAISLPVVLVLLNHWTELSPEEALEGFASPATITVLAMFILSEGIRRSGAVQLLGNKISNYMSASTSQQLSVISVLTGPISGFVPNTPVVAMFVPMVTNIARRLKTSPSKLLIPLSFVSMLGGMLTLVGTSTNILASSLSARLIGQPFSMFEFLELGLLVLGSGLIYIIFVSHYLIPERIDPMDDLTEEYEMGAFLTEVVIEENSRLVGQTVGDTLQKSDLDVDLVQITRAGKQFMEPLNEKTLRKGDHLIIRTDQDTLLDILQVEGVKLLPQIHVTERQLEEPVRGQKLIETVIPKGSFMEGETLEDMNFLERYDTTVMAVRRGGELTHRSMKDMTLHAGDVLLLLATETTLDRLRNNRNFIIAREFERSDYRTSRMPIALGIMVAVVFLAALDMVPIVIGGLAGVVAMTVSGCLKPGELYDAVNWQVIFLLAGLIPLGISMQQTGLAEYLAHQVMYTARSFSFVVTLGVFYLFTAIMTNLISNNASVVLMIPVAVDAATKMGADPFPFLIAVTFAASTAFMTPMGYQTNLMVYGPGGYKFRDFLIVGAPLQLLLTVVTPVGIKLIWGF